MVCPYLLLFYGHSNVSQTIMLATVMHSTTHMYALFFYKCATRNCCKFQLECGTAVIYICLCYYLSDYGCVQIVFIRNRTSEMHWAFCCFPEYTLARLILLVNLDEAGVCTIIHDCKPYISVIPWCLCVVPQQQIISRYEVTYCYVIIINNLACWCVGVTGT